MKETVYRPDATDQRIIAATQAGLPLSPNPYREVAEALELTPQDVMARMAKMLAAGVIRRIGVVPNHYALGVTANGMSVWDVRDEDVSIAGREVGALEYVSHCYHRPRHLPVWRYNLFAMVHGRDRSEVSDKVSAISDILGPRCSSHDVLYSSRILKKTGLRIAS